MKVLGLTRYDNAGASSRLRSFQYGPLLAAAGIDMHWRPLFNDDYIDDLYSRRRKSPILVARAYARRAVSLAGSRRYDLVWVEKEALPWMPALLDPGLLRLGPPYVVDYDDAVFHYYDRSRSAPVRKVLGKKIDSVMRHAALVVAGNGYLAKRARDAGASWVEILPTVVDLERYRVNATDQHSGLTVGWVGSPSTQRYLDSIVPVLSRVLVEPGARFITVGAGYERPLFAKHEIRAWSEATEANDISSFDVGIMPLPDSPFERGKCGYKLIQYMACGRSVVASPVGVNIDIVQHGNNGFLASTAAEWEAALLQLKSDAPLRSRMGEVGREIVERRYSVQKMGPRLVDLLKQVAVGTGRA